ncbi:uncharacterized protein LOC144333340 [Macaca mulatta]
MSWAILLRLHTVHPRKVTEACRGPSLYDFTLCILRKSPKHVMGHPFTTSHCLSSESHRSMSWGIHLRLHTVRPRKVTKACRGASIYDFTLCILGKPPKHVVAHPFTTSHCPSSESHRSMSWPIHLRLHTVRPRKASEACHGPSIYDFTLSVLGKSPSVRHNETLGPTTDLPECGAPTQPLPCCPASCHFQRTVAFKGT